VNWNGTGFTGNFPRCTTPSPYVESFEANGNVTIPSSSASAYVGPDCSGVPGMQGPDAPDYTGPLGAGSGVGPDQVDGVNPEAPAAPAESDAPMAGGQSIDSSPDAVALACGDGPDSNSMDVGLPYGLTASAIKDPKCNATIDTPDPQVIFPSAPYRPYAKGHVTFAACTGSTKRKARAGRDATVCLQVLNGDTPRRQVWETIRNGCQSKHTRTSFFKFELTGEHICSAIMPFRRYRVHVYYSIHIGPLIDTKRANYPLAGVGLSC
jgi:hypothetical protein